MAAAHTRDMIARHYFAHIAPGGATPATRLHRAIIPGPTFIRAGIAINIRGDSYRLREKRGAGLFGGPHGQQGSDR